MRRRVVNRNKSLQDLDGEDWGQAEPDQDTYLVQTCLRLRHTPLRDFRVEDLRIMIGQDFSLEYLLPIALERLEEDPLAEGDFYPGDLLSAVLKVEKVFWASQPFLRRKVEQVVRRALPLPEELQDAVATFRDAGGNV